MSLASRIKTGQVYVNTYGAGGGVELPFGGYKKSGYGREKGLESLASYTQVKNVCVKLQANARAIHHKGHGATQGLYGARSGGRVRDFCCGGLFMRTTPFVSPSSRLFPLHPRARSRNQARCWS